MRRKERERERLNCFYLGIEVQGKLDTKKERKSERERESAKYRNTTMREKCNLIRLL